MCILFCKVVIYSEGMHGEVDRQRSTGPSERVHEKRAAVERGHI